ncbi:MAG: hypothetical protein Q8O74_01575 [bacterium]|nr:hypothetical protein [bacterium]
MKIISTICIFLCGLISHIYALENNYEPLHIGNIESFITLNAGLGYTRGYNYIAELVDTFPPNTFKNKLPGLAGIGLGFGYKRISLYSHFSDIFPIGITDKYMKQTDYYSVTTLLGYALFDTTTNIQITPQLGHIYIKEALRYSYLPDQGEPITLWEGIHTESGFVFGGDIKFYNLFPKNILLETCMQYCQIEPQTVQGYLYFTIAETPKTYNGFKISMGPYFSCSKSKINNLLITLKLNL